MFQVCDDFSNSADAAASILYPYFFDDERLAHKKGLLYIHCDDYVFPNDRSPQENHADQRPERIRPFSETNRNNNIGNLHFTRLWTKLFLNSSLTENKAFIVKVL